MTYDSNDGRLRAGSILNGDVGDFHPEPFVFIKESGWHRFAIRCVGKTITYELDGKHFHTLTSKLRKSGSCGVFYTTTFNDAALSRGLRVSPNSASLNNHYANNPDLPLVFHKGLIYS